jgi:N-hydroxyarylamine O-acetyltransferase
MPDTPNPALDESQVKLYLERIGIPDPAPYLSGPSKESLDSLVTAHQLAVPFENLDIYELKKGITLDLSELYEKVVTRRRGGYCFELNRVFFALLLALGYKATARLAEVVSDPSVKRPPLHRLTVVDLDSAPYLVDVGFGGPMAPGAVAMADGIASTFGAESFVPRIQDTGSAKAETWALCRLAGGEEQMQMRFVDVEANNEDFIAPNFYCSASPESFFSMMRMVNIRKPTGSASLMGDTLRTSLDGFVLEKKLASRQEVDEALSAYFGIVLPA